jgi:hypothetical protein
MRYDGRELTNDSIIFVEEQKSRRFEAILSVDAGFAVSTKGDHSVRVTVAK